MHPAVVERHGEETIATAPHLVQFRDGLLNSTRSARARIINATGAGILRGGRVECLAIDRVLSDARPVQKHSLPRRLPAAQVVDAVRQNTIRLVRRRDPLPEEADWAGVLSEHEPPDATLPDQCESVRVALAEWAGISAAATSSPDEGG
jgi:hypothetical protein